MHPYNTWTWELGRRITGSNLSSVTWQVLGYPELNEIQYQNKEKKSDISLKVEILCNAGDLKISHEIRNMKSWVVTNKKKHEFWNTVHEIG